MYWNPLADLKERVRAAGGFVNAHSHLDRAFSVSPADFGANAKVEAALQEKWQLVDAFKARSSEDDYFERICLALKAQAEGGTTAALSFVDCCPVSQDRAVKAAARAREWAAKELRMRFRVASQTLKGVLAAEAREWFERALPFVDVIGGLPGADAGREREHIDILLEAGKRTGKRVHVHVDQLNSAHEKESELLARRTIAAGMEGRVTAVHGISIGAHPKAYRLELYRLCKDAGLGFVACPTAWIDSRRNETLAPTHNSVTPVDEMIPAGLTVALGSDNICDVYKPYADGDMLTELRVLLESTHFYDAAELVRVAAANGRLLMGLEDAPRGAA